jgi:hypothetical protein
VAFLRWLWYELYGDEPFDADIRTRLRALPEPFAERLDWEARYGVYKAACAGDWGSAVNMLVAGLAESKAAVSPAERDELDALLAAVSQGAEGGAGLEVSRPDSGS